MDVGGQFHALAASSPGKNSDNHLIEECVGPTAGCGRFGE